MLAVSSTSPTHIVRTCRAVVEDLEPGGLPSIPRGTYGVDLTAPGEDDQGYPRVDFGPPWGIQNIDNADLVDAAAVLGNAKNAIALRKRPWRNVIRRTLRTFAGPYLLVAAERLNWHGDEQQQHGGSTWPVEAYLYRHGSRKKALALLAAAIDEAEGRPHRSAPRSIWEAELEAIAVQLDKNGFLAQAEAFRKAYAGHNDGRGVWEEESFRAIARIGLLEVAPRGAVQEVGRQEPVATNLVDFAVDKHA